MLEYVIKRDGSKEKFNPEKLNKWAEYATQVGGNWSEIAQQTFKRLQDNCKTTDIHDTMVAVCLDKKSLEYSRVASRLEYAEIRKGMQQQLNFDDRVDFKTIYKAFLDQGIWSKDELPAYSNNLDDIYTEVTKVHLDFWQVKQWIEKYSIKRNGVAIETPHLGYMGIALALFGDTQEAKEYALALVNGKINLPTPALNGLRNGDWDTISCCVISAGDNTDSLGTAHYIAYRMTAKKAGIGFEYTTRSKGDSVKGGRVEHLGKWPLLKTLDREVKCLTQITRGGNATVTMLCIDPEIENALLWKSQRVDIEQRIDKLDYEFGYNDAFLQAVIKNESWYLFSLADAPVLYELFYTAHAQEYNLEVARLLASGAKHKKVQARDILTSFLTVRQETGRYYDNNLTRTNQHTPFIDVIRQSNLCEEISLPTKPYTSMQDLFEDKSNGETAFCSLSAINARKTEHSEYEQVAYLTLKAVDKMINRAPMLAPSMKESIKRRRSVGIGITGLASYLYNQGMDYNDDPATLNTVQTLAELHYFYLLKASQRLSSESGISVQGIKKDWLPIDTAVNPSVTDLDWESLRGKPRKHSVLVAHMPTESSSLLSGSSNGLYPVRKKIINKRSRKGLVQFICTDFNDGVNKTAWECDNITLSKIYGRIQDFTDQAISCDFYVQPGASGGKLSMSQMMKEWVAHAKLGNKTKYYLNTDDFNGGSFQDQKSTDEEQEEDGCESCKL